MSSSFPPPGRVGRTLCLALLPVLCCGSALAAPPLGQTIWLYHPENASYVSVQADLAFQLNARETASVQTAEKLLVEDAGQGRIRFQSALNGKYVRVNLDNVDKLVADAEDGSDPLTHFLWTDLSDGKVELRSVGDNDLAPLLSPSGSAEIVRANATSSSANAEFTWGLATDLPPNIVFIYIDDWAWNGSSVAMDQRMANSHFPRIIEMPHLDAIAANGMVFRNAYGSPQCTPARAAIQTGQSNARNGMTVFMNSSDYYDRDATTEGRQYFHFPVVANGADRSLRSEAITIPEALAPYGYVSAHLGKWHLRGDPGQEGYALHDGATTNDEGNNYTNAGGLEALSDPKLMTHITDTGLAFMEAQVAAQKPFYLQLSHYAVHGGNECTPASRARYQNVPEVVAYNGGRTNPDNLNRKQDPAVWLGMIYELDQKIGQVREKLVELGIEDHTYLIVSGDNGYRHSFYDELSGLPQPLHSRKWWAWQGGIRIPQVIEGPGIPPGSFSTVNVANYDFLPTFVDWAGGDPTSVPNLDGRSLAGLLRGEAPGAELRERGLYFHYPHYRNTMPHSAIVKGGHKAVYFYETPVRFPEWEPIMLFDLHQDGGEYHNIYSQNPSLGQALYAELSAYLQSVGARLPQVPNPNYQASVYETSDSYGARVSQGPFVGSRGTNGDEGGATPFFSYWMDSWGTSLGEASADFDGDGESNLMEYARGGDPTNALDAGQPLAFSTEGGSPLFQFPLRNDDSRLRYQVERSPTLLPGSWSPVSGSWQIESGGGDLDQATLAAEATGALMFYRLQVTE
ncbi:MAG: sulfatase-like hydrolase/transferase [Verrucomicrobiota bacterium]